MIEDTENPGWQYQLCDKCGYKLLDETGDTGDHSMIAVAAATLSMLGIALVVSKKKEF
jgi:LPXTG-motif cell wall-anchored protein